MNALILLSEWEKSQIEFWRKIPNFNRYDVSTLGRLRLRKNGKILNGSVHNQGYHSTTLIRDDGKRRQVFYHRVVAEVFMPNPDNLPECNHLTGVKFDARLGTVEWSSRIGNQRHAWATGLITAEHILRGRGRQSIESMFTESQVLDIRKRRARGESGEALRKEYNVKNATISAIATGAVFKDIGGPLTRRTDEHKLEPEQVRTIRRMVKEKVATQKVIAQQFNIDPSDVSNIAARKRYAYVA